MIMLPTSEPISVVTSSTSSSSNEKLLTATTNTVQKHVTFEKFVTMVSVSSYKSYKSELWYDKVSLDNFRQQMYSDSYQIQVQAQQQYQQQQLQHPNSYHNDVQSKPTLAINDTTRGCEQRCCYERQRRKQLGNQFIVRVGKKLLQGQGNNYNHNDAEQKLADIAMKCNEWSRKLAHIEGLRDYYRAYYNYTNLQFDSQYSQSHKPTLSSSVVVPHQQQLQPQETLINTNVSIERIQSSYATVSPTIGRPKRRWSSSSSSSTCLTNETNTVEQNDAEYLQQQQGRCKLPRLSSFELSSASATFIPTTAVP